MAIRNAPASETVVDQAEPGAVDNRLSLVPSDFPMTETWEDGMEYDLSELGPDTKIRQISPGEYEVIPGASARQAAVDEEAAPATTGRRYSNRAVEDMANEI